MAYGFKAVANQENVLPIRCIALSGNGDVLGVGDAVVLVGSSSGGGSIGNGPVVPAIARGAATGALFGYIVGIDQVSMNPWTSTRLHRPASTACYIDVVPFKAGCEYQIQADAACAVEDMGENANLATITDASTATGISTMALSTSSIATSQTAYQMTIMRPWDDGSNLITSTTPDLVVRINNIQANPGFAGV